MIKLKNVKFAIFMAIVVLLSTNIQTMNVYASEKNSQNLVTQNSGKESNSQPNEQQPLGPIMSFLEKLNMPIKLPTKGYIALTFDDGPYAPTTNKLLDKLKEYNAKATFFVLGSRVEKYSDTLKRIDAEGHQIGNHSYSHKNLTKLNDAEFDFEINKTDELINNVIGEKPVLLRPPYGASNKTIDAKISKAIINWNVDTLDWKYKDISKKNEMVSIIKKEVLGNLQDGNIILMHDIHENTVDAMMTVIEEIHRQGYRMVTVSELAKIHNIKLVNGEVYRKIK